MSLFTSETNESSGLTVIAPAGDVDLSSYERLYEAVMPHLTPDATVVIDCAGITFVDSMGLRALISLQQVADEAGANLVLTSIPAVLTRVLELSGTIDMFPTTDPQLQG